MPATHTLSRTRFAQRVVRVVYPHGSIATVRRGPLKGYRVVVSPSMGFHFIWQVDRAGWAGIESVKPGACVYDVVANFGQSTLRLANAVGPTGQVIALEPMPATFATLRQNIEINRLTQVTLVQAAAAATDGTGPFTIDLYQPEQGRLASVAGATGAPFDVPFVALDSYRIMGWRAPDLIKIDTEGGASVVLE